MPRKTKKKNKVGVRLTPAQKKKRLDMLAQHGKKTSPNPWTGQRCSDSLAGR